MPLRVENLLVIGGGRWARVLAGVGAKLLGPETLIRMHTSHNVASVRDWAAQRGFGERFEVQTTWPPQTPPATPVIVANAAAGHERAARWALDSDLPVLVEKPFTLNSAATGGLLRLAASRGGRLAAAHVLLFASHLDALTRAAPPVRELRSLRVDWADAAGERRAGELKQYDAAVPVYADVLPHVVSILRRFTAARAELVTLTVQRGGALVRLQLALGALRCEVTLERDAPQRRRSVEARSDARTVTLEFASEPGVLTDATSQRASDPDWDKGPRPVARMLTSFFEWAQSGIADPRLSCEPALAANELIDAIHQPYRAALARSLAAASVQQHVDRDPGSLAYCIAELLGRGLRPSGAQIAEVLQQLRGAPRELLDERAWLSLLNAADADSWMKSAGLAGYVNARVGS